MDKNKIKRKIKQIDEELKETALEIVDDMSIMDDYGDTLTCVISANLLDYFRKLDKKHNIYHEKLETA